MHISIVLLLKDCSNIFHPGQPVYDGWRRYKNLLELIKVFTCEAIYATKYAISISYCGMLGFYLF